MLDRKKVAGKGTQFGLTAAIAALLSVKLVALLCALIPDLAAHSEVGIGFFTVMFGALIRMAHNYVKHKDFRNPLGLMLILALALPLFSGCTTRAERRGPDGELLERLTVRGPFRDIEAGFASGSYIKSVGNIRSPEKVGIGDINIEVKPQLDIPLPIPVP